MEGILCSESIWKSSVSITVAAFSRRSRSVFSRISWNLMFCWWFFFTIIFHEYQSTYLSISAIIKGCRRSLPVVRSVECICYGWWFQCSMHHIVSSNRIVGAEQSWGEVYCQRLHYRPCHLYRHQHYYRHASLSFSKVQVTVGLMEPTYFTIPLAFSVGSRKSVPVYPVATLLLEKLAQSCRINAFELIPTG